jgi:uncharacterized membrane protein YphA (DoxX/SURF4 family)
MNLVQRVEHWGDTHHPQWLDVVRILLGVFLCYKGVDFLMNMGAIFVRTEMDRPFAAVLLPIVILLLLIYFLIIGNGKWQLLKFSESDK